MNKLRNMKRSQLLMSVQASMLVLCFAALIAAVAFKFTGGKALTVVAVALFGGVMGVGSRIVGIFVARAMAAENPMLQIGKLLQQISADALRRPAPPLPFAVTIRPTPSQDCRYALTLHNGSPDTLVDGSLDHSRLLHPGQFGLDDTHMPADIWIQPPVQFDTLAPGAEITWEVEGYNVPSKYDGSRNARVTFKATPVRNGTALGAGEKLDARVSIAW